MGLREDLARDIHRAGVTSPDLLAEYLIERGWVKEVPGEEVRPEKASMGITGPLMSTRERDVFFNSLYGVTHRSQQLHTL